MAEPPAVMLDVPRPRWITWRSILLGSLSVVLVCGLTPYNDFVVANTYFVCSYLPVAMVLVFFLLIVGINAPLWRFRPRWALASGELAVIMTMMLVSCSIPSQGLLRSFVPMLAGPFHYAAYDEQFRRTLIGMELPNWLFPVEDVSTGADSWVIRYFYSRVPEGETAPYSAWIVPLLAWGVFIGAMWATLVALVVLLRYQWMHNERLPFPLAQLEAALIESPRPGRALNDLLGRRSFWIALVGVVIVQSLVALGRYFPKYMPEFTLTYDMSGVLTERPLIHLSYYIKRATLYFTFVGVMYFVQTRVAFSLWSIYILIELLQMWFRTYGSEVPYPALHDQHLGACVAFVAGALWIGRHHWAKVLRHAFRGRGPGEAPDDYGSYRAALLVAAGGILAMVGWMVWMGVQPWLASAMVAIILLAHFATARIVAETGLALVRTNPTIAQIYTLGDPSIYTARDIFFAGTSTTIGAFTTRESAMVYAAHGLWVADSTSPPRRHRIGLLGLIAWSLILGYAVGCFSSLYCYYNYVTPIARNVVTTVNPHGSEVLPRQDIVKPLNDLAAGRFPTKPHDPYVNFALGAGITGLLQAASLRWSSWPFTPVGYLITATWFINPVWFSIMLGWLVKLLLVRFGGGRGYQQARPFFVGLIFGEALAVGLWLIVNLTLAWLDIEYQAIHFLPA